MRHLLLPGRPSGGEHVVLSGDDFHYLVHVLRRRAGDGFDAVDAAGDRRHCTIVRTDSGSCTVEVQAAVDAAATAVSALPAVTVFQAVPKGGRFDDAVRALVQAGVTAICPIETERSVVRLAESAARRDRWLRVAREAAQQSGAGPVRLLEPRRVSELTATPGALSLFLHPPLAERSLHGYLSSSRPQVELVVGPEGGFSDSECRLLRERGFDPLSLGPLVLRSQTAAFFAVAAIRILLLERAAWQPT